MNLAPILGLALLASPQEAPLDLHVEGAPLAGRPLELVVTGPAERAVMLRVHAFEPRTALESPGIAGLLPGTRAAAPRSRLLATRADDARVLAGVTDAAGRWSHVLAAPAAGTRLVLQGLARDDRGRMTEFEALELDVVLDVVLGGTAGASAGASTPLPDPGMLTPCNRREDVPDAAFLDTNCDGIDGDRLRAVFVSVGGAPNNPGTMQLPLDSVQTAIEVARAASRKTFS
jgi:hypothetical protein